MCRQLREREGGGETGLVGGERKWGKGASGVHGGGGRGQISLVVHRMWKWARRETKMVEECKEEVVFKNGQGVTA